MSARFGIDLNPLDALSSLANDFTSLLPQPVKDFVNSSVGQTVLTAFTTGAYGALAGIQAAGGAVGALSAAGVYSAVGPQLASLAFAIPGLAKGDDFSKAYMTELGSRIAKTIQQLGGSDAAQGAADAVSQNISDTVSQAIPDQIQQGYTWLSQNAQAITGMSAEQLAAKLGIRVDAAQYAIDLAKGVVPNPPPTGSMWDPNTEFDPMTGQRIVINAATSLPSGVGGKVSVPIPTQWKQPVQAANAISSNAARQAVVVPGVTHPSPTPAVPPTPSKTKYVGGGAAIGLGGLALAGVGGPLLIAGAAVGGLLGYLLLPKS